MVCPCCCEIGSKVTKILKVEGRALIRFWKCLLCEGRFVTEGFSYDRLRLVMIKTENGNINNNPFIPEKLFIKSRPLRLIKGKSNKYIGKKNVLNFFLNKPFL
jgi:transcriptional regulator NrdR family protein